MNYGQQLRAGRGSFSQNYLTGLLNCVAIVPVVRSSTVENINRRVLSRVKHKLRVKTGEFKYDYGTRFFI